MTITPVENQNREDYAFPVRIHVPSSKPESTTHRLAIFRWKETTDKKTKAKVPALSAALFCSVPKLELAVEPDCLSKAVTTAVEELQDSYMKERVEQDILAGTSPVRSFHASDLTPEALATWYATTQQTAGKLSQELIDDWFTETMKPALQEALAQLPSIQAGGDSALEKSTNARLVGFRKVAAPTFSMVENDASQLLKALSLLDSLEDDKVGSKLHQRLTAYMTPNSELISENL